VTVDGGETWYAADVEAPTQRSWQKFKFLWLPEKVGPSVLASRAIGDAQPADSTRNCIYMVNVTVAARG